MRVVGRVERDAVPIDQVLDQGGVPAADSGEDHRVSLITEAR